MFIMEPTTDGAGSDPEFDIEKYMPQSVNNDWFDFIPQPVPEKYRHLIDIRKPIALGMIGKAQKI